MIENIYKTCDFVAIHEDRKGVALGARVPAGTEDEEARRTAARGKKRAVGTSCGEAEKAAAEGAS